MFISTLYRDDFEQVERWAADGGLETVNKPRIITHYSRYMSGVNKADQLMVYYPCGRKSLKWYKRIFWCMLDHSILNAFILHKAVFFHNTREFTHEKFRMELAYAISMPLLANLIERGHRSPADSTLVRLKGKHFPFYNPDRKRCVVCGSKKKGPYSKKWKDTETKNFCCKCQVHLCYGVCFERYHTESISGLSFPFFSHAFSLFPFLLLFICMYS